MTDINYPLSIRTFLLSGNSRQQAASFMTTDSRSGKTYFKKIAQDQNTYMNVSMKFNRDEVIIFQSWFRNTLKNGFLPFNIELCTEWGNVGYQCRFMPDSLMNATKDTPLFSYSAQVLIYNYGPPYWIPSDIDQYPEYLAGRNYLDIIINTQLNKVT